MFEERAALSYHFVPAMNGRHPLHRNGDFVKLWAAQSVSYFGSMLGALSLTALVFLDASPAQMGLLAMAQGLPVLLFALLAGVLVDRLPRRPVLILSDLGRFGVLITVPVAAVLGELTLTQLYVVAFLGGALELSFNLAYRSYLPGVVGRERLLEANARLSGSESVAEVGSPAAGGLIVQTAGGPAAVLVDAMTYLWSAAFVATIRKPEPPVQRTEASTVWRQIGEGLQTLWRDRILRALAASGATAEFFGGFLHALYSIYLINTLGFSPLLLGLTISAGGLGSIAGALIVGKMTRLFGYGRTIVLSRLLHALFTLLIPLAGGPLELAFAMIVLAQVGGDPFWMSHDIASISLRQAIVPERLLGRVSSGLHVTQAGMLPLGALTAGLLAELIGVRETLLLAACGILLSVTWLLLSPLPRLRELPASSPPEPVGH